jgi:anti-sigma factor RsiW
MSREKYSGWMTDAALGELRAEREPELLAHAMECDACREALSHARAVHDFVDRGVESLVAGEPSPHFATNLRRRIAQESEPLRIPWTAWTPIVAGGLALAALLLIMVARKPLHDGSNPSVASAVNRVSVSPAASADFAPTSQDAARTQSRHDSERGERVRTVTIARPEILVPQGQLAAALQLSAAINSGTVDANRFLAAQRDYGKPLEVKPIEITPLEIPALDDATDKPAGSIQF